MTKKRISKKINPARPYNELPFLPPAREKIESVNILRQLVRSSVALAELKGLTRILPNPDILLNAVIIKEARISSEIENVITTQDKLYQALSAKGAKVDLATKEVMRYREAMLFGLRFIQKNDFLSANAITDIQKKLEGNNAGIRRLPGTTLKNAVSGKVIYTPPDDHSTLIRLFSNLEKYINEEDGMPPLIRMAVQHYQFESIHPFYDGNGRTGRIINILYLILHKQLDSPVLYLSEYIIRHKSAYYRLLQETRNTREWENWVLFVLKGVEETANDTIAGISAIHTLFLKTQARVRRKAPKIYSKELIELLFEQPYCKIEFLIKRLGITRITASRYLKELEAQGVLRSRVVWKETLYINVPLFELLKK